MPGTHHVLAVGGGDSGGLSGWLAARALPTGWLVVRTLLMSACSSLLPKYIGVLPFAQKAARMLASMSARQLRSPHQRGSIKDVVLTLLTTWGSSDVWFCLLAMWSPQVTGGS